MFILYKFSQITWTSLSTPSSSDSASDMTSISESAHLKWASFAEAEREDLECSKATVRQIGEANVAQRDLAADRQQLVP